MRPNIKDYMKDNAKCLDCLKTGFKIGLNQIKLSTEWLQEVDVDI